MAGISLIQSGPADAESFEYHWTGDFVEAHLLSDMGKKRTRNEDSCILCVPEDSRLIDERGLLFGVADGMGGANAGDFASQLALETLSQAYYSGPAHSFAARLQEAIEEANQRVFVESEKTTERHGMGTTVSVVVLHGDCAYVGQVGDSRVYVARQRGGIFQITADHSLVAEQVRDGYLTAEEARTHSLKNLITRAVGIKDTVKIDLFSFRLQADDTVLICSDGLSNLVNDAAIGNILVRENLQGSGRVLVGLALKEGGTDNITAVLFRVTKGPPSKAMEPGVTEVHFPKRGILAKVKRLLKKSR
jgi:protein phosphatase